MDKTKKTTRWKHTGDDKYERYYRGERVTLKYVAFRFWTIDLWVKGWPVKVEVAWHLASAARAKRMATIASKDLLGENGTGRQPPKQ